MIKDLSPFVKLVQKFIVANYELIMGISGKIFHNFAINLPAI